MYVEAEIRKFIKAPTLKKVKEAILVNHQKILQVILVDGSINYYWSNHYNLRRLYDYSHLIQVD